MWWRNPYPEEGSSQKIWVYGPPEICRGGAGVMGCPLLAILVKLQFLACECPT